MYINKVSLNFPNELYFKLSAACEKALNLTLAEVFQNSRKREYVQGRQMISNYLRMERGYYLTKIADIMGCHHSTVIHRLELHEIDFSTNEIYQNQYKLLKELI